ncbi:sulfate/molybdate ABC transporter ATP-binding protein [Subdoligranulum variabile]|uniref:sulfate/molybdate ABC transporter ATP-binding protein n=1 Tax=Subdoligranulum variabile TaxID=214851 RepID=UPI0026EFCF97|nr:ATP-binding cassette domain-containing protein [Subdoligranulum variabile]
MSLLVDIEKDLGGFRLRAHLDTEAPLTGLLGASGCGKSLTLQCIAGIQRPDRGRIVLDGRVLFDAKAGIDLPPQQRRVGYLFQHYALFPTMTVAENIRCGAHGRGPRAEQERIVREMVALLQLQGLEQLRPAQLSGGQAQRVALARMLAADPQLLLLDEPFSALDAHLRDQLQPQLRDLLQAVGRQAVLVTHSRDEAYRLCSTLCIMDEGRTLRTGPTKEVFADPRSVAAARLTGCKNVAAARRVDETTVEVPDWGIRLQTARPVPEDLQAVGLRAHYFNPRTAVNRFAVQSAGAMEEPFEWCLLFRYAGQAPGSDPLWWRMPKDKKPAQMPAELGIAPENVLLLTE